MNANASFDPEPAVKEANANQKEGADGVLQPGGSVAAASAVSSSSGTSSGSTEAATSAPAVPEANSSSTAVADPNPQPDAAPAAANTSFHPSLLKPGETMQDQQMQGAPPPKSKK
jgi:hypothetical protein